MTVHTEMMKMTGRYAMGGRYLAYVETKGGA